MSTCLNCAGTGVIQGPLDIGCAACNGSGRVLAGLCAACDGEGFETIVTDVLCHGCKGSGVQASAEVSTDGTVFSEKVCCLPAQAITNHE